MNPVILPVCTAGCNLSVCRRLVKLWHCAAVGRGQSAEKVYMLFSDNCVPSNGSGV